MFCTRLCLKGALVIGLISVLPAAAWQADPPVALRAGGSVVGGGAPVVMNLNDDFYQYDDGTAEGVLGLTGGGEIAWMHVFETQAGGEVITAVSTAIGSPEDGSNGGQLGASIEIYVWSNPGGGDPSDGDLLGTGSGVVTNVDDDVIMKFALDAPVPVSGFFTIGASINHVFNTLPAPRDTDQVSGGRAWVAGVIGGNFDPNNIDRGIGVFELDAIDFPSVFLLRANAESDIDPCDIDCNGVVDAFDIEPFLELLYGNIEPCAPGVGDVNGDGTVDAFDIQPFFVCLFGGGGGGQGDDGRLYFDLAGNAGDSGPHPGSTAKENPMLVDDGRLFIYWEYGGQNQGVFSPNYDITIDGGTIVTAWNYNNPNVGGLFGPRWDVWNPVGATSVDGPVVSFTAASITTFGMENDIAHEVFDEQFSIGDGPFGSTLLGFVDVSLDAGQSSATVWITVGQEGIAIEGGDQQTPMFFGFDDDPVGAGDVGDRTRIAEATIITKQAEGACCLAADDCVILTEVDCLAEDGKYLGDETTCEGDPCQSDCPWDLDDSGTVGLSDLLELLEFWGNPYGLAELLDLLAAWGPCP